MISFFPDFLNERQKANIKAKFMKNQAGAKPKIDTDETIKYSTAKDEHPVEQEESKFYEWKQDKLMEITGEFIFIIDRSGSM